MEIPYFKNIFFFRWRGLGDLILDTPLLRVIKENFRNTKLNVITSPLNQEILKGNPYIDGVYPEKSIMELAGKKCDLFIDMMGNSMTLILFLILKPRYRMGFEKKIPFLNLKIPFEPTAEYTVNHRLRLLKSLNIKNIPQNPLPETYLTEKEEAKFKEKFKDLIKKPYITVFPFARGKVRDFREDIFSLLNDKLIEKGFRVIFIFDEKGKEKFLKIKKLCKREPEFIFKPSLRELIFIFKHSKLYVGPDTGPRHIAISQKTRTLTFFTHTNPVNWTPPDSKNHRVLTPEIDCHPCETRNLNHCKRGDFKCLFLFEPEKILKIAEELLKEQKL